MVEYAQFDGTNYSALYEGVTGAQKPLLIGPGINPNAQRKFVVQVSFPSGGSGKVQATASSGTAVLDGTAVWVDWNEGEVSSTNQIGLNYPPTAIRAYPTSGNMLLEVSAR